VIQGFYYRSLFYFFTPYVPLVILGRPDGAGSGDAERRGGEETTQRPW
jgi:hypothetical protein